MTIIVAEDDRVSQTVVSRTLENLGYGAEMTPDGAEVFANWSTGNRHILVSDRMMPDMSEVDLCRRIRPREAESGAYTYLTAQTDRDSYLERLQVGRPPT